MKGLTILGATGSIGMSTLDVVARYPDEYKVVALTARNSVERMFDQCVQYKPQIAVMLEAEPAALLRDKIVEAGLNIDVMSGIDALMSVAAMPEADYVMCAIVGAAGLQPSLAAARAGKRILLANKEALVMSGHIFMEEVKNNNAVLLPIDSEHNAIFQCMPANYATETGLSRSIKRILLTASGGPFRTHALEQLHDVTPEQAIAHPNWSMGQKISVDSATMMNKGLEVIEACWLFNASPDEIQVVIHPQSVIHSMVEYLDGSVLAQMGQPDMRTPIAHALAWPERMNSGVESLDLFKIAHLDFEEPDFERFQCLQLSYAAIRQGGTTPAILNAANEIAVQAFLDRRLAFTAIPQIIDRVLQVCASHPADSLDTILADDKRARELAHEFIFTTSDQSMSHH